MYHLRIFLLPFVLLFSSCSVLASAVPAKSLNGTATQDLVPRATTSGISPIECTLQLQAVQCCQTFAPLSTVAGIIGPILSGLGIPLPGLGTVVAFDCHPTLLGLGCDQSTLCCTLVVPNQDIGLNCQPVAPLLGGL